MKANFLRWSNENWNSAYKFCRNTLKLALSYFVRISLGVSHSWPFYKKIVFENTLVTESGEQSDSALNRTAFNKLK